MDIVIIANFCRDFSKTDNGRFTYLAKELSKEHDVEIITSSFSHSKKKQKDPLTTEWPFIITFLKEPGYNKNISFRRFYSHFMWGRAVKKYLASRKKPEVIYCAVPSLTGPRNAAKYCEKNGIRFIIDIQDLWPEAFKIAFNLPVISNIVFLPFSNYANSIYKRANDICGVSKTYVDRAIHVNDRAKSGHVVYLGTNLDTFDENVKNHLIKKDDESELWIGYCGSMGDSYDLNTVIDALSLVDAPIRLIALGDGEKRKEFEQHAIEMEVPSSFTGRLPYDEMCGWLDACDVVVNPIVGNSAASIINKHADYAASGKPVINTQNSNEYRKLVEDYKMGFNCENGNPYSLAETLTALISDEHLRKEMGKNARRCAEDLFDRNKCYQILEHCIVG